MLFFLLHVLDLRAHVVEVLVPKRLLIDEVDLGHAVLMFHFRQTEKETTVKPGHILLHFLQIPLWILLTLTV